MKETVWAHTSVCGQEKCHEGWKDCGGGKKTIFGREYDNLCHGPLKFTNPDVKTLENIKKLLLLLKPDIDNIQTEIERGKANA